MKAGKKQRVSWSEVKKEATETDKVKTENNTKDREGELFIFYLNPN